MIEERIMTAKSEREFIHKAKVEMEMLQALDKEKMSQTLHRL